jgi:hypothetical protein
MAEGEAAAPPFVYFISADAAKDGVLSAYFGTEDRKGYKFDFATSIVPEMIVQLTARMKAVEHASISDNELFATSFEPTKTRFGVGSKGPAIVYELPNGITIAMHVPKAHLAAVYEQMGRHLAND